MVGADRGAAWATARSATMAVERGGTDVVAADVQIHGFPFLTQLLSGSLEHVTGSLARGSFGGFRVTDVRLDARGVEPRSPWHSREARADGVVAFDTIASVASERLGVPVTVGPAPQVAGALTLGFPLSVLGASVDVAAVVLPAAADGALTVQVTAVTVGGVAVAVEALPGPVADQLGGFSLPLDLPHGVTLVSAAAEPDGVRLTIEAADVDLRTLAW